MKVSVFGNEDVKEDNLVVKMVPVLRKKFPKVKFEIEDPTEGLKPPASGRGKPSDEEWVILDVGKGIKGVKVFDDLEKLVDERRVSLHDYDVSMELKLLKKIGRVKKIKIIAVEVGMNVKKAEKAVVRKLKELMD